MSVQLHRRDILPEAELPDADVIMQRGRECAADVPVGDCAFLTTNNVSCEAEYKRQRMDAFDVMIHSQIGYRDPAKTKQAWREIWERAGERGARIDRYGICLDWSMGFPPDVRRAAQRGTGLILAGEEAFAELTAEAPVAPHFGDFVIGMPAAVENTSAALKAGSTAIGNLGQYFTFRLPGHDDDIGDTAVTLEALSLCAAQPVEILIHSNLDDGFAALFTDLACSLGAVLLERHIVDRLIGGHVSHCYGHSFSEMPKRLAFQLALAQIANTPGTMVYGNTVSYAGDGPENYAALATYLAVDIAAQAARPSGHAINPVPITEASRIPDIDEAADAAAFAGRLIERAGDSAGLIDVASADAEAARLVFGANLFLDNLLSGFETAGIDTTNPFEMLLALRRIGPERLEELFGPGTPDPALRRGRNPVLQASTISALEAAAGKIVDRIALADRNAIRTAGLALCVCTTDVHEYGKILLQDVLARLGVTVVDGGVHAEPDDIVALARSERCAAIAISTYNGVALDYLQAIKQAAADGDRNVPIIMGGRTNQIPSGSNTSLPTDVTSELRTAGAIVCPTMDDLAPVLLGLAAPQTDSECQASLATSR